jgi:RimJ/RimL family protein N-acetyltransferase
VQRGYVAKSVPETKEWLEERLRRPTYDSFVVEIAPESADYSNHPSSDQRKVIGIIGSPAIPHVGYIFHPTGQGKGYATEALNAFMEVFWKCVPPVSSGKDASFDYARASTDADNMSSRRLLERCGFSFINVIPKHYNNAMKGGLQDEAFYLKARPGMEIDQVVPADQPELHLQKPSD